jgi:hypothetical protein
VPVVQPGLGFVVAEQGYVTPLQPRRTLTQPQIQLGGGEGRWRPCTLTQHTSRSTGYHNQPHLDQGGGVGHTQDVGSISKEH